MIITRSPLRISLGGGGTDLPSYYRKHSGFLIAAAIDKYVYITLHQTFVEDLIIKYSKMERVSHAEAVQHPIIREALCLVGIPGPYLELTSMADIPAGTGLGSSGSFTTALLKALHTYKKNLVHHRELAEQACHIEIDLLSEPIGKQDQYIAAYGGLTCFQFLPNDYVEAWPLKIDTETLYNLEDNLLLFFTGYSRAASNILKEQDDKSKQHDQDMVHNLHFVKELGYQSQEALETGNLRQFAELMNVHWEYKKQRSGSMSNDDINRWYDLAVENGALGGKLIGAGGGGFLMFYAEDKAHLRRAMRQAGLQEVRFRFDFEGTKVVGSIMTQGLLPVAILAGGLATRLQPLTTTMPKALVEVHGEPFIAHQLRLLRTHGITRVVVCAGYLGGMLQEYVGDGEKFGVQVRFAFDGTRLLGTAGALKQALPLLGEAFFVLYGDSYLLCDYGAIQTAFEQSGRLALMTVFPNDGRWDRSNVAYIDGRILAYDKRCPTPQMRHIDYGLGVFHHTAFAAVPEAQCYDLATLYQELLARGALAAYEVGQRFYEIGSFAGLEETRQYLAAQSNS